MSAKIAIKSEVGDNDLKKLLRTGLATDPARNNKQTDLSTLRF